MFPCERVAYPVWTRDLVAYLQLKPNHCQVILYHLTKLNWALSLPLLIILLNTGHYQLGVRPFFFRFGKRKEKRGERREKVRREIPSRQANPEESIPADPPPSHPPRGPHPPSPPPPLFCWLCCVSLLCLAALLCFRIRGFRDDEDELSLTAQRPVSLHYSIALPPSLYRQQVCTAQLHCEETVTRREAEEPPLLPSLSSLHHHPSLIYWSKPPRGCSWAGPRVVSPWFAAGVHKHHREREGQKPEGRRGARLGLEGRGWEQEGKEKGRRRRW